MVTIKQIMLNCALGCTLFSYITHTVPIHTVPVPVSHSQARKDVFDALKYHYNINESRVKKIVQDEIHQNNTSAVVMLEQDLLKYKQELEEQTPKCFDIGSFEALNTTTEIAKAAAQFLIGIGLGFLIHSTVVLSAIELILVNIGLLGDAYPTVFGSNPSSISPEKTLSSFDTGEYMRNKINFFLGGVAATTTGAIGVAILQKAQEKIYYTVRKYIAQKYNKAVIDRLLNFINYELGLVEGKKEQHLKIR